MVVECRMAALLAPYGVGSRLPFFKLFTCPHNLVVAEVNKKPLYLVAD